MKKLIAFDLDGTLAESKQAIDAETGATLAALLAVADVAIISGGDWPQFETQVVAHLPEGADLSRLHIMPTTGTKLYEHDGSGWHAIYADIFSADERARIIDALKEGAREAGLANEKIWGEQIEDRGSQITFSGLGQEAPLDAKKAWDPDFAKRKAIQGTVRKRLPDLSVNVGGSTSIDITRAGGAKASGLRKLVEHSGIGWDEMLFMGDAIYPGGNDYPPKEAGMDTILVRDVTETRTAIATVIACLK